MKQREMYVELFGT